MNIQFSERDFIKDSKDLFELCPNFHDLKLSHHPFIVFGKDEIELCDRAKELAEYDPNTVILTQWEGKWKSNWFQFTVADYLKHLNKA